MGREWDGMEWDEMGQITLVFRSYVHTSSTRHGVHGMAWRGRGWALRSLSFQA